VWSDDFDDGDYAGWTVDAGMFSAEENVLNPMLEGAGNTIYRVSSVSQGTWSFDAFFTEYGSGAVDFMLTIDNYGYELEMPDANMIQFYRMEGGTQTRLIYFTFQNSLSSWQHFDITRDSDGRTCIYHNGTLVIDTVETTYSQSQVFVYITTHSGQAIDNIVVSNTVDIEPPPQIPFYQQTWFLTIIAAVIVIAVMTVFLLRRKPNKF